MTGAVEGVRRGVEADIRLAGAVVLPSAVAPKTADAWAAIRPLADAPRRRWQARRVPPRRLWSALAEATHGLTRLARSQPDERRVAQACLRAAAALVAADRAEITLAYPAGRKRVYQIGVGFPASPFPASPFPASPFPASPLPARPLPTGAPAAAHPQARPGGPLGAGAPAVADSWLSGEGGDGGDRHRVWLVRPLRVGRADLGQLRLLVRRDRLMAVDSHVVSIFATEVASALYQAATDRRLQALAARGAYDAVHDPLTGLVNRSAFLARASAALHGMDPRRPLALLLLDVDGQTKVNDTLGRGAGDQVLAELAQRLLDQIRPGELLGRLGNDEFALLMLSGPGPSALSVPLVERARLVASEVAGPVDVDAVTIAAEVNAGVAVDCPASADLTELLRRAEVALHQAKATGERLVRYEPAADSFSADGLALLAELRDALASPDQLTLCLQPTVDLLSGAPLGAEALVRWRHPRRGLLAAAEFVGAIDHSDLAADLTKHVVAAALSVASGWASQGLRVPVSVNLCERCALNPDLPGLISDQLASRGVAADRLVIEITETVLAKRRDVVESAIGELRSLGVQVCVDDFGTAAASLAYLTTFPVDQVKIARSFVASMLDSPRTAAIVRATVELARELGLRVIAKGVERVEQRDALLELGVSVAQGHLFHSPMQVTEATAAMQGMVHRATAGSIPVVRASRP